MVLVALQADLSLWQPYYISINGNDSTKLCRHEDDFHYDIGLDVDVS